MISDRNLKKLKLVAINIRWLEALCFVRLSLPPVLRNALKEFHKTSTWTQL